MRIFIPKGFKRKLLKKYYFKKSIKRIGSYKSPPSINNKCRFSKNTHLGNNCHFNGMEINGDGSVIIGDNFHSGPECLIITQNHNINGNKLPYDDTYIKKNVIIEDNVWLGSRVIILGGVTIGEGAVIQAGSVVVSSIPPLAIAGGHPAVVFSERDRDHYYSLKERKEFH
jgi:acetyltransferase-like isoleucine patch superfamily enzyme